MRIRGASTYRATWSLKSTVRIIYQAQKTCSQLLKGVPADTVWLDVPTLVVGIVLRVSVNQTAVPRSGTRPKKNKINDLLDNRDGLVESPLS